MYIFRYLVKLLKSDFQLEAICNRAEPEQLAIERVPDRHVRSELQQKHIPNQSQFV